MGLYFKNKRNLEKNNVHFYVGYEFTFTMVKEWGWLIKAFQRYAYFN